MDFSKYVCFLAFWGIACAGLFSCEPEEEKIDFSPGLQLKFSTDTVLFDTVFSGSPSEIRNITQRLVVYNPYDKALNIATVALGRASSSPYTLLVNGQPQLQLSNQTLLGKDSLLLLLNLAVDPLHQDTPFLIKDSIVFEVNNRVQDVKLIAYGQDANFIEKGDLTCDEEWAGVKPYVLKDTVWIKPGCRLTIQKGARIYFNNKAALIVEGELKAMGEKEERILFSNSRLDIKNEIGLWAGIHLLPGSNNHEIYYADIRNSTSGISLEISDEDSLPDLILGHTKIENASGAGVYAKGSDLYAFNSLINNTVGSAVENIGGGNYTYLHCTLVDFALAGFFSPNPVVYFSDTTMEQGTTSIHPMKIKMYNNIIWSGGNLFNNSDLQIHQEGEEFFLYQGFNLIRSSDETQATEQNLLSTEMEFPEFVGAYQYNYQIDSISPAIDKGKDLGIALDLEGNERDENPDIGAFEYIAE